jgi:hypothetical protein
MLFNIVERATNFGSVRSRDNFFSFTLKVLLYIVPAVILGHYTDITIKTLQTRKVLGDEIINYIALQTLCIISTLYLFIVFLKDYISEFQVSVAGGYFIVLYFGIQTNYINMLKEFITI